MQAIRDGDTVTIKKNNNVSTVVKMDEKELDVIFGEHKSLPIDAEDEIAKIRAVPVGDSKRKLLRVMIRRKLGGGIKIGDAEDDDAELLRKKKFYSQITGDKIE